MKTNYHKFKYVMALSFFFLIGMSVAFSQATLMHSYTFEDGTANDSVAGANGTLKGDAYISDGAVILTGDGYVNLPAKTIDIPSYTSVSLEAIYKQAEGFEAKNIGAMLFSFGQQSPDASSYGANYLYYQPTRNNASESRFAISCGNTTSPWSAEEGIFANEIDDTSMHYVAAIVTGTQIKIYQDGALLDEATMTGDNSLANVSNDTAFLGFSVYSQDSKWEGEFHEFNIFSGELDEATIVKRAKDLLGIDIANAHLSEIEVNKGSLDPVFDTDEDTYDLYVEYGSTSIIIDATTVVNGATVEIFDGLGNEIEDGLVTWEGDGIDLEIKVTALNGTTQESYYISIYLDSEDETASLTDIELSKGYLVEDFDMDSLVYTAILPYGTSSVDVTAVTAGSSATVTGDGTISLTNGEASTTITVTSADGNTTKAYTLNLGATKVTTGQFYYIVNEASDSLVLGGSHEGDNQPQLYYAIKDDSTQLCEFVPSGVEGQYFIRNMVPSYLSLSPTSSNDYDMSWVGEKTGDLDSIRFELNEFEPGRFLIYSVKRSNSDDPDRNMMGPNDPDVGDWLYSDKWEGSSWDEAGLTVWNILPPDEVVDPYDTYLSDLTVDEVDIHPDFEQFNMHYYITLPDDVTSLTINAVANDETATISGTGTIDVSDGEGDVKITVTATDDNYSTSYYIHYQEEPPLTLMHSYTFGDGTARDQVGTAHGEVADGSIESGVFVADGDGDYITLPADEIAINTYPSITWEAYVKTDTNDNIYTMLSYFGGLEGNKALWLSLTGGDDTDRSRLAFEQGDGINNVDGEEPGAGENHHYVSVISNDTLLFYVDGSLVDKAEVFSTYAIGLISTENAWLCKGGYASDPEWNGSLYEFNIYAGQMDPDTVAARAYLFPAEDETSNATLSDLTIADTTITGFSPYILDYKVGLQPGSAIPSAAATTTNSNASAVVNDATALGGTTTIDVTAEDGVTTAQYTITFYDITGVSELSSPTVNVYPNVFENSFKVEVSEGRFNVAVYNITGNIIHKETDRYTNTEIFISKPGMYFVMVERNGEYEVYKVLKVR